MARLEMKTCEAAVIYVADAVRSVAVTYLFESHCWDRAPAMLVTNEQMDVSW